MGRLRLILSIACMLLGIDVIALGMLLSCGPMRLGGLVMLVGRFLMHFLWHEITPLSGGLKSSHDRSLAAGVRLLFASRLARWCASRWSQIAAAKMVTVTTTGRVYRCAGRPRG